MSFCHFGLMNKYQRSRSLSRFFLCSSELYLIRYCTVIIFTVEGAIHDYITGPIVWLRAWTKKEGIFPLPLFRFTLDIFLVYFRESLGLGGPVHVISYIRLGGIKSPVMSGGVRPANIWDLTNSCKCLAISPTDRTPSPTSSYMRSIMLSSTFCMSPLPWKKPEKKHSFSNKSSSHTSHKEVSTCRWLL